MPYCLPRLLLVHACMMGRAIEHQRGRGLLQLAQLSQLVHIQKLSIYMYSREPVTGHHQRRQQKNPVASSRNHRVARRCACAWKFVTRARGHTRLVP